MRFFSGTRDKKPGKMSASAMYKQGQNSKPWQKQSNDEKYKKMIEAKLEKAQQNALLGIKAGGGFTLPGTKAADNKPKELTMNGKKMMSMLAVQKAQKEAKLDKKKQINWEREQKAMKKAQQAIIDKATEEMIEQAKKEAEAAYAAAQANHAYSFFGGHDD